MKKSFLMLIAVFLCVGIAGTAFAGGPKEKAPEKEKKLIVWDWQVMENYMAAYEVINKMFMEKYPDVVVERKAIASGEFEKQLKPVLSSGEPPDIFQVQLGAQAAGYYEAGILHDFYPDWKADPEWQKLIDYKNDPTYAGWWYKDKLISLPAFDEWIHAVYYYKDMLKKYGWDKPPRTVDEWIEISKKLNNDNIIPLMTAFGPNSIVWIPNELWVETVCQKYGANALLDIQSKKVKWSDPIWKEGLHAIKRMMDNGVFNKDVTSAEYFPDVMTRFQNKQAFAFYIAGDWTIGSMNEEDVKSGNIGVTTLPLAWKDSRPGYGNSSGVCYGMLPDHPKKQLVIDYIKYTQSAEAGKVWLQYNIHPTSIPSATLPVDNPLMKEVIKESTQKDYWYTPHLFVQDAELGTRLVENLGNFFLGRMTVDELCKDLDDFMAQR